MLGRVHLITDSRPGADPVAQVRALLPMATSDLVIQFRPARDWSDRHVFELGCEIAALCRTAGVKLLVNDRIDIAMAIAADGAHVGASDLPVAAVRKLLGPGCLIGATVRSPVQARQAVAGGADYIGVGPCYGTSTKDGLPPPLGVAGLAAITPLARAVAIGGITIQRVPAVMAAGAHGVAVVGAVADAPDPAAALAGLLAAVADPAAPTSRDTGPVS